MQLRYITCSDIRENASVDKVIELLQISSKVEIGIQAHRPTMNKGMPRHMWLENLLSLSDCFSQPLNIAIHINHAWCSDFCDGIIPEKLQELLDRKHKGTGKPIIKRWQLNLGDATSIPCADKTSKIIKNYRQNEFVFPYNNNKKLQEFISRLDRKGVNFSLLYDSSYGAGISPESWNSPVYMNHAQGYAGGLSPENVSENLDKIAKVAGSRTDIWIDAEGKLKIPGTKTFDIQRAKQYINAALNWQKTK